MDWRKIIGGFGAGMAGMGPQYLHQLQQQPLIDQQMQRQRQEQRSQDNEQVKRRMAQEFMVAYQNLSSGNPAMAAEALRNISNTPLIGSSPAGKIAASALNDLSMNAAPVAAKKLESVVMDVRARYPDLLGKPYEPKSDIGKLTSDYRQGLVPESAYSAQMNPTQNREMREDRNGILRFVDNQEPVFPNVVDTIRELSGQERNDIARGIRAEISKANADFIDIANSWDRISASGATAAGDLALIFNYMKMLDPGSTVREGEFATAQNAAGVPERVRAYFNNIQNGERLTESQRADFLGQAQALYEKSKERAELITEQFVGIGGRLGVGREDLVIDRGPDPVVGTGSQQEFQEGATATNPQTGERVVYRNGQWVPL